MLLAIISYTLIIAPFSGGRVPYFLSGVALPAAAVCSALIQFVGDQGKVCHLQVSAAVKIFKVFHIGVSFQMKSDFLFIGSTIREPVGFRAYGGRSRECGGSQIVYAIIYHSVGKSNKRTARKNAVSEKEVCLHAQNCVMQIVYFDEFLAKHLYHTRARLS